MAEKEWTFECAEDQSRVLTEEEIERIHEWLARLLVDYYWTKKEAENKRESLSVDPETVSPSNHK